MKKLFLPFFFLLSFYQVNAQHTYLPGYVLQEADTVNGWVRTGQPKKNSTSCWFRTSKSAKPTKYAADEIKGYGFAEGRHYRSRVVLETIAPTPVKPGKPKPYFLNVLVAGKATLLAARDQDSKDRFFLQKDTVFKELELREDVVTDEKTGTRVKVRSKLYVGVLTALLKDCPTLTPDIQKTAFKPSSLSAIIKTYNRCLHPDSLYFVQQPRKSKTTFGVIAGPNFSFVSLATDEIARTYSGKPGFTAGLTMNTTLPFVNDNFSLQTELLYVQNVFQGEQRFFEPLVYIIKGDLTLHSLKLPVQFHYAYNFGKVRPYLNAGLICSYDLSVQDRGTLEILTPGFTHPGLTGYYLHHFYLGLIAGGGASYLVTPKHSVFLDFKVVPEGLTNLYQTTSGATTWYVSTGFTF